MKNIGHRARSRDEDQRSSLPRQSIENNTVFSECARAYLHDYIIFMRST